MLRSYARPSLDNILYICTFCMTFQCQASSNTILKLQHFHMFEGLNIFLYCPKPLCQTLVQDATRTTGYRTNQFGPTWDRGRSDSKPCHWQTAIEPASAAGRPTRYTSEELGEYVSLSCFHHFGAGCHLCHAGALGLHSQGRPKWYGRSFIDKEREG